MDKYYYSKKGLTARIYADQRSSSKKRGYKLPKYNLQQLREWMFSQDGFDHLYSEWVKSGYKKGLKPSLDRIDDYICYKFSNMQLMTWDQNDRKGNDYILSGKNTKYCKSVIQYSLSMEKINTYYSGAEAHRQTSIHKVMISRCCSGQAKTAGGFIWAFKKD